MTRLALAALTASLAACSDSFAPTVENMAGTYQATTLVASDTTGIPIDYLAIGSEITLILATDGTVTGHLLIIGGNDDGGDLVGDMTGTWALQGDTVTFDQAADTFVRDWEFVARRGRLSAVVTSTQGTARVVFTRQS